MIKLTYGQFKTLINARALGNKLINTPLAPQLSYAIKKMFEQLTKQGQIINTEFMALQTQCAEKYGKKDAEGKLVRPENQPDGFEVAPENMEAYEKEFQTFDTKEVMIDRPAFSEQTFQNTAMQLSAAEWSALEPLFVDATPTKNNPDVTDNVKQLHQAALDSHTQNSAG